MAEKNLVINQIFKGISPSQYFGAEGTYNSSSAIDPDLPIVSTDVRTSGFPVPVGSTPLTTTNVTSAVIREVTNPKDNLLWTVQANGKIVTFKSDLSGERLIGTVAGTNAVWAEYYNNYIYIFGTGASKDDVSRVGPLNTLPYDTQTGNFTVGLTVTGGTSGATGVVTNDVDGGATGTLTLSNITGHFVDNETITDTSTGSATVNRTDASLVVDNVWKGATLGSQTALTNTKYPTLRGVDMPNHVAFVHTDSSLYFLDFKNGQGLVHRISTVKVTNEGDTNGTSIPSLYNALDLPYGFYPTALTNYGTDIMVTGIYTTDTTTNQGKSAFVLWDPTNAVSFYAGPTPLADPLVTALLNVNGNIYVWTGNAQNGVRLSLYAGGVATREVVYQEEGYPPFAGAVDALGNRIVWGGYQSFPTVGATVWAYGSKNAQLPPGLHNVMSISASTTETADSYDVAINGSGSISATTGVGQSFTGNGGSIVSCQFKLAKAFSPTGTMAARLYAHSGTFGTSSVPTGSALATSNSVSVETLSGSTFVTFTFPNAVTLVNGTKYVITIHGDTGMIGSVTVGVSTAAGHAGNPSTQNSSNVWSAGSGYDFVFYVYTSVTSPNVTALKYVQQNSNITPKTVIAWRTTTSQGIDQYSTTATLNSKMRWMFNIGTKFSVTYVSIPLAGSVASGVIITPTLYFDDLSSNKTLTTINNTNYPSRRKVTYKGAELKDAIGYNNFVLEIAYTGTDPLTVALPITITVDIKDDEV